MEEGGWERRRGLLLGAFSFFSFFLGMGFWEGLEVFCFCYFYLDSNGFWWML